MMNEQNKQFLSDNYSLKEQAEAGTLVLDEVQKRQFYTILHEEVSAHEFVNLYSQEAVNAMVKDVFEKYEDELNRKFNDTETKALGKPEESKVTKKKVRTSEAIKP